MAKPLQYCKVISLQLIKINEKKLIASLTFYFFSVHLHNRKLLLQRASLTQYSLNCIDPGIFIKYLQWVISWDILDKEASPLVLLQFSRVIQRTQITTMIMQVTPPLCHCQWNNASISVSKRCCSLQAITLQLPLQWALKEHRME